ncbi:HD domain-containing protein [Chromobacterium haemolyticum]|uniref:HD domain-containing protein n=1 Tax=Chromobacterium haemolyticum TaxID=394935 RepID=UPI00131616DD|nr:HD domain-containing protein [Chromobacterium haemolyticum]BBH11764.1 hypothetical protein CH06BL_10120 [Chromobacterium haemolyticum]
MGILAFQAMQFAFKVHANQRQKYTNKPYTDHLAEVAGIVAAVVESPNSDPLVATAWLHDCVEDQAIKLGDLMRQFGAEVACGVMLLSDIEIGNRAERKAASRLRLSEAPWWVQTIKVADMISNTSSIVEHDPKFAAVYLEEKRLLLDVLTKADQRLVEMARNQINRGNAT